MQNFLNHFKMHSREMLLQAVLTHCPSSSSDDLVFPAGVGANSQKAAIRCTGDIVFEQFVKYHIKELVTTDRSCLLIRSLDLSLDYKVQLSFLC
jgi:hypothetical protein